MVLFSLLLALDIFVASTVALQPISSLSLRFASRILSLSLALVFKARLPSNVTAPYLTASSHIFLGFRNLYFCEVFVAGLVKYIILYFFLIFLINFLFVQTNKLQRFFLHFLYFPFSTLRFSFVVNSSKSLVTLTKIFLLTFMCKSFSSIKK